MAKAQTPFTAAHRRIVRDLAEALLPKGAIEFVRQNRNTKIYSTWDAAVAAAGKEYGGEILSRFRLDRAKLNAQTFKAIPEALSSCLTEVGSRASVIDLGGATGEIGVAVLRAGLAERYQVVENPSLVNLIATDPIMVPGLEFSVETPAQCDIFFTSGTIPYIADPMSSLKRGFDAASRFAVLARNSFAPTEIFRVQASRLFSNGVGLVPSGYTDRRVRYAHRTSVESEIVELARQCGFSLTARVSDNTGVIPYRGIVYGGCLIFARR